MSFNEVKEYSVPYKDKVEGQIIDPVEWNANFTHIEEVNDENRQIINTTFDNILNDGANHILIDETVIGAKQNLKEVLLFIKAMFDNYYTSIITDEKLDIKLDKVDGFTLLQSVAYDEMNGKFTFTKLDGTQVVVDTLLEKLLINFSYDASTQQLVLTANDGTVYRINISEFITIDEIVSSDQILATKTNNTVVLTIKSGSIKKEMIDPAYREELTEMVEYTNQKAIEAGNYATSASTSKSQAQEYANQAATFATNANNSANNASDYLMSTNESKNAAKSHAETAEYWAVGTKNGVAQGGNENAKYYATVAAQAKTDAEKARDEAQAAVGGDFVTPEEFEEGTKDFVTTSAMQDYVNEIMTVDTGVEV